MNTFFKTFPRELCPPLNKTCAALGDIILFLVNILLNYIILQTHFRYSNELTIDGMGGKTDSIALNDLDVESTLVV